MTASPLEPAESEPARSDLAGIVDWLSPPSPPVRMDDIDRQILFMLSADPRVSRRHLGRELGMSAPAVGERIDRLEREGVITGYTTIVDWAAVGRPMLAYIPVTLAPEANITHILGKLRELPELEDLVVVTGSYDFIARFRLRDQYHLQSLLLGSIWPIRGIQRVETLLGLGEIVGQKPAHEILQEPEA